MNSSAKILVQAIGNPLRGDDALGPLLVEAWKGMEGVDVEWVFQLHIEDSEKWSRYSRVIIIDAHANQNESVFWSELKLTEREVFHPGSHQMEPEMVLGLCSRLFSHQPRVFVMSLKGDDFSMKQGLSENGSKSLQCANQALKVEIEKLKRTPL